MFVTFDNDKDLLDLLDLETLDTEPELTIFCAEALEKSNCLQVVLLNEFLKRQNLDNDEEPKLVPIKPSIFLNLNDYFSVEKGKGLLKELKKAIAANLECAKTYKMYKYYMTLLQILQTEHAKPIEDSSLTETYFLNELDVLIAQFTEALEKNNAHLAEFLILNHWQRFKLKQFCQILNGEHEFFNIPLKVKLKLIKYNRICSQILEFLYFYHKDQNTLSHYRELLFKIKKKLGNTALTLSGGGTFALFHIGILVNLFDMGKLPKVISGCSGGAIVAAIFAVNLSHEQQYSAMKDFLLKVLDKDQKFDIFGETTLMEGFINLICNGSFFANTKKLQETLINFLGEKTTFRDIYLNGKMVLNISVSGNTSSSATNEFLLNFNNSPDVLLWSSVTSSCSLPLIFPPHMIYSRSNSKNNFLKVWNGNNNKFLDGSMLQDLPIKKLSEMFNIDNVIASQVNPHIFPLLHLQNFLNKKRLQKRNGNSYVGWLLVFLEYLYTEIIHWLSLLRFTSIENIFKQNYYGDMTVLPKWSLLLHMNKLLANPNGYFIMYLVVLGIRQFWFYSGDFLEYQLFLEFEVDSWIERSQDGL